MPCGHPASAIVGTTTSTAYCEVCAALSTPTDAMSRFVAPRPSLPYEQRIDAPDPTPTRPNRAQRRR